MENKNTTQNFKKKNGTTATLYGAFINMKIKQQQQQQQQQQQKPVDSKAAGWICFFFTFFFSF